MGKFYAIIKSRKEKKKEITIMKKLDYSVYFDKSYGCWLGKSIGGACGALSENNKKILHYTLDNVFPDVIPPNDDLDLQVLWLVDLLEKKGTNLTSKDFALSFAEHNLCLANEYATAIRNIECGVYPPVSGVFANDFFKNSMGCPIRSEIWAAVAPGTPTLAKKYVLMDGSVDHDIASIHSELFNAAMECAAFFENDILKLIEEGLSQIPEKCVIRDAVNFVLASYQKGESWETARNSFVTYFGSQDASYSVTNCGLTLLSLLYGEKDYTKTLLYSVNGGYDTDCTAATALSILGIITGAKNTPKFWLDKIGDELVVGTVDIDCPYKTIKSFAEASVKAGLSFFYEGLLDVEIVNIPDGITGSLPKSKYCDIEFSIDYMGAPAIGTDEEKTLALTIKNVSDKKIEDTLTLTLPEALICDFSAEKIALLPNEAIERKITVKSSGVPFSIGNIMVASFGGEDFDFGLIGAMRMTMIGPFWDDYDTTLYDSDPYGETTQRFPDGGGDLNAMFGGFVNYNREYIDESFKNLDDIIAGKTDLPVCDVNIHSDIFDIENYVTYQGPACVYLVYDFEAFEEAKGVHHFGAICPFKAWENGKLIADCEKYLAWNPYNINPVMDIKKGKNRMVFKVTRNDIFRFSWIMRNELNRAKYYHQMKNMR